MTVPSTWRVLHCDRSTTSVKVFYDSQYIDWGGRWFSVAKHRGESDLAGLGRGILEDHLGGPVSYREDFNFSHAEMDGISAMNLQLAKLGQLTPYFPELKDKLPPQEYRSG